MHSERPGLPLGSTSPRRFASRSIRSAISAATRQVRMTTSPSNLAGRPTLRFPCFFLAILPFCVRYLLLTARYFVSLIQSVPRLHNNLRSAQRPKSPALGEQAARADLSPTAACSK